VESRSALGREGLKMSRRRMDFERVGGGETSSLWRDMVGGVVVVGVLLVGVLLVGVLLVGVLLVGVLLVGVLREGIILGFVR
jgi:hypothetical protein